jgi:hypothetical protein
MNKRKLRKTKPMRLTADQSVHLLCGWCLDSVDGRSPDFPFKDEEHRKQCWIENRDLLMSNMDIPYKQRESFRDIGRQQIRPLAWWQYEAGIMPLFTRTGYYKSEIKLLEKLGKITERDKELFKEIEEAEKEYSETKQGQGGQQCE